MKQKPYRINRGAISTPEYSVINRVISRVLFSVLKLKLVFVVITFVVFALVLLSGLYTRSGQQASAASNNTVNFQARLLTNTGALVPDGNYHIEFKIYDQASGGTLHWTETRTTGNLVAVKNGYISVTLGSVNPFSNASPALDWGDDNYLTMNIGGSGGSASWNGEMSPRMLITSVPYAFRSAEATTLKAFNGVNATTLSATAPTANRSILLPDADGTVCLQNSATCGYALLGSANTFTGVNTFSSAGTALQVTNNATIGGTLGVTGLTTATGGLTVGTGSNFINQGSTLFSAITISDVTGGGNIGTAATTVDVATTFNVNQTTGGQTLTLPSPTNATAGRMAFVNNTGSTSFTMYGSVIATGKSNAFIWNGTAWVTTVSLSGSVVNTIGTLDSVSKVADGASISANAIYLQTADAYYAGLVSTGTQTFAGAKTFTGDLIVQGNTTIGNATTDRLTVTSQILGGSPLVFQGATDNSFATTLAITDPTTNNTITLPDASGTVQLAPTSGSYIKQVPTSTAENTITPTANSVIGLTVNGTSGTATTALAVSQPGAATGVTITSANNTATNGLSFSGTFTNLINSPNFVVTNAGAVTAVGVNSGTGLVQGTGGLTITGATNINTSGANATNIGTGTNTGTIGIGSATAGTISIQSAGAVNTTAGAASTISTSAGALTLTSAAAATWSTTAGNLTLQAGSGTVSLGTSTALTATGALGITSGGANALTLDTGGAATLSVGVTNANALSISRSGITTTVNGVLTVAENTNLNGNTTIGNATTDRLTVTSQILGGSPLVFQGATDNGFTTTFAITDPTANNTITFPDASGTVQLAPATGSYIKQVPTATADNTITPTTNSVVGLTVNGTSGTAATALAVSQPGAAAGVTITSANNTATNGLSFSGTFTNYISAPNFSVTNAGAVTAVGVNSGTGLVQGTGGLTITGATNINTSGANATNIGTGTNTGTIGIGSATAGTISIQSAGAVNTTAGAASTISTSAGALTLTSAAAATWSTAVGNLTLQAGSGTVSLGTSTALTATGALGITSGGANALTLDTGGAASLSVGATNANAVSISRTGITTTVNGNLTVAENTNLNGNTTIGNATTDRLTVTSQILGGSPLVFQGATDNGFATTFAITDPTANNAITFPDASGTVQLAPATGSYIKQVPTATADNTITPTTNSVVGLTVNGTSGTAATALAVSQPGAAAGVTITSANNTATNGLSFSGTFTNYISAPNFSVTNAGAVTAVGVNSGTGLVQGTGGLTITGATNINTSGANATNIGTGTNTGTIGIGSATAGTISIQSAGAVNTTAGAASTISTSAGALTLTSAAAATWSTAVGNLTLQAGSGTVSLGTSTALTATGALGITSGGANALTLDTGGAASLSVGATNANAVSISRTGITTTVNGNLTVAENTNLNGNTTIGNATTDRLTVTSQILGGSPLVFQGATDNGFATTFAITDPTANNAITFPDASGTVQLAPATGSYIKQVPTATADNTITPTTNSVVGLTVNGTSGTAATALAVSQPGAAAGVTITSANNTATNGLSFSGTFTNYISAPNFSVTNAGAVTAVGVNSGTGLVQGTGGLTITGATNINTSGANATNIGTGTNTGTIGIGSATAGTISIQSAGAVNTTAGAASTISTSAGALTLTSAAAATWSTAVGNLTLQAGSGTVSLGTSTALTATGALGITSGGANALTLDTGGAASLSVGATNANAVSISRTGITTTVNGNLTVAENTNLNGNTTIGNATTDRLTVTSQILGGSPLVFQGATDNGFATTFAITDPTANNAITFPDASGTVLLAPAGSGNGLVQVPTSNTAGTAGANVIQPTAATIVGMTVNATSNGTTGATALVVNQGNVNGGTFDGANINITNTTGTIGNGLLISKSGAGTVTSLLNLTQSAGTATNGIIFNGTITTDITTGTNRALNIITNGTGVLTLDSGTTGQINLGTNANNKTIQIGAGGATAASSTVNIANSTGAAQTVNIGSTNTTSTTTIQAGSGNINLNASTLQFTAGANRTINVASAAVPNTLTVAAGSATGANTNGAALYLQGGSATSGNASGGNVFVQGGTGIGTGAKGLVVLDTATYLTAATQSSAVDVNITQANIDSYGAIVLNATAADVDFTLSSPTLGAAAAGRVVYVTAANGSSDFTLRANVGGGVGVEQNIAMRQNTTATMIWNGTQWTAAGASSSTTLQAAYDNTLSSAGGAEIVLNNTATANGLTVRNNASNPIIGGIFETQTSIGSNLFSVNNNATEFATNGGAETLGASASTFPANTWDATTGGTIDRWTTAGDNIATGAASVRVQTGAAINHGARNRLSTTLTNGLTYSVSFAVRGATNFTTLDIRYSPDGTTTGTTQCATAEVVTSGIWTRINCTFVASGTITAANSMLIRQTDAVARTFYIDNLSVNINASATYAADGSVDNAGAFGTNWTAFDGDGGGAGTSAAARDTGVIYDSSASARADTSNTANMGIRNNMSITPAASTQYLVSFYARAGTGAINDLTVRYSEDGGTSFVGCVDYNTQAINTTTWTKITCLFTADSTVPGSPNPDLVFTQATAPGGTRSIYIDALSITLNTNNANNVQIGGANKGGPTTLFTLDRSDTAPIAANNDAYLGSMYYDTTTGRIQCYEADGWGACGSAPDNIVNLNPEYAGAVLNGTGVGTMTADLCADQSGVLQVNATLCDGTGSPAVKATNFYKWTSPQASQQTYSIYVSYQLPTTFKSFSSDDTVQLTARVDSTTNAAVTYEMFRSEGGTLYRCGTGETSVTTTANTWQTVGINGNESTGCGFTSNSGGAYVIFKINVKANSNANAFVSTLSFVTTGK